MKKSIRCRLLKYTRRFSTRLKNRPKHNIHARRTTTEVVFRNNSSYNAFIGTVSRSKFGLRDKNIIYGYGAPCRDSPRFLRYETLKDLALQE